MFVCAEASAAEARFTPSYTKANEIEKAVKWLMKLKTNSIEAMGKPYEYFQQVIQISTDANELPMDYSGYVPLEQTNTPMVMYVDGNSLKFAFMAPAVSKNPVETLIENNSGASVKDSFDTLFTKIAEVNNHIGDIYGSIPLRLRKENISPDAVLIRNGQVALIVDVEPKATAQMLEDFLLLLWNTVEKGIEYEESPYLLKNACNSYLEKDK